MDDKQRTKIIKASWELHNLIENSYLGNPAIQGDEDWPDKQRILLADMAIHLLQTSVNAGDLEISKLQNNLHSILTIADQFLPEAELKNATDKIYSKS